MNSTTHRNSIFNITAAQEERYSKIALGCLRAAALGCTGRTLNASPTYTTLLTLPFLADSLIQSNRIKDYYNPVELKQMRDKALTSNFLQVLDSHGSIKKILDEKILTLEELKNKKDLLPKHIKKLARDLDRDLKNIGPNGAQEKPTQYELLLDKYETRTEKLLQNSEDLLMTLSISLALLNANKEIDDWEKSHKTPSWFSSQKTCDSKDYHNPDEIAKMREEALSSDFSQLLESHGSVTKILEAKILRINELQDKINQTPQTEKSAYAKLEMTKWKHSHLISSLGSFFGKYL